MEAVNLTEKGTAWVNLLRKNELIDILRIHNLNTNGKVTALRKRLNEHINFLRLEQNRQGAINRPELEMGELVNNTTTITTPVYTNYISQPVCSTHVGSSSTSSSVNHTQQLVTPYQQIIQPANNIPTQPIQHTNNITTSCSQSVFNTLSRTPANIPTQQTYSIPAIQNGIQPTTVQPGQIQYSDADVTGKSRRIG